MTLIYWLAALQTVPAEYYEARRWTEPVPSAPPADHAPGADPFSVIIIVLTANENLHAFALIQALTGGGYYSSEVVEVYIFRTAFAPDSAGGVPVWATPRRRPLLRPRDLAIALLQAWAITLVSAQRKRMK